MERSVTTLRLVLDRGKFDMIASGQETIIRRAINGYWNSRLLAIDADERIVYRHYDTVVLRRGFTCRRMEWTMERITTGYGDTLPGHATKRKVYQIHLGRRLR